MEREFVSIEDFLLTLKKRWKIVVLIFLIFIISSLILSFFIIKPKYEASTKFFIGKEAIGENQNYSANDIIMYQTLMKTYSEIIRTPDILLSSIEKSKINSTVEEAENKLTVIAIADTQILEVKYRSLNPNESRNFINNLTSEFVKVSKEILPNGNVKVVQRVRLPEKPVSPNKKINVLIGALAGIVLGIASVFLIERFDKTIKSKEELEKELDIPIIGSVPLIEK
ncbi:YveK family protein [Clostridium nigeriense]|uniref:YveK family protein n=1 Tax=Clostridium nigeriense TaxID=1805470 RepID=UPI00082D271E|nr:Wzz/FepE/Etk N-terminal domain-containing protein [Clostridium nigeriense]